MKRRTIVLGGGAAVASLAAAGCLLQPRQGRAVGTRSFDWKGGDFLAGGTKSVPKNLPDPVFRTEPNCIATCSQTLGPCHVNDVAMRSDVSEGLTGLPVRLSLRIVTAGDCRPVEGADVELWHTDVRGVYSGRAADMCNPDDGAAKHSSAFRGRQMSDADGRVDFLTVYPGWYDGRTVHIHFRMLVEGRELLITQLLFDDTLSDLVFAGHPDYAVRPARDTTNSNDGVFEGDEIAPYVFDVEKLDSGVLQATHTIGVSLDGNAC
ncbi:dioxygenase family protein [Pararhizobium sp.]|uniref:dioxygenase family protein n=1 Tax=Pararhizobium sp. TaxID=1977563 RepID=UPI002717CC92|nr:protocatechuate 3,4-dioxygenase [Pararhizobium sp.]MDO9415579.1 protocatechuate 3,4-dioxygenase [Pararhizobium sp.]